METIAFILKDEHASSQVRLLRVIQERRLERVGANHPVDLRIRIISATHRPLRELVDAGSFREDLFYRLVVYPLHVPPLRERGDDIRLLTEHFLRKYEQEYGPRGFSFSEEAHQALRRYPWPGNVRELENVVHTAMVRADTTCIGLLDLPAEIRGNHGLRLVEDTSRVEDRLDIAPASSRRVVVSTSARCGGISYARPKPSNSHLVGARSPSVTLGRNSPPTSLPPEPVLTSPTVPMLTILDVEKRTIREAIEYSAGNLTRAAKQLGIGRATLYRKLARYGLQRNGTPAH